MRKFNDGDYVCFSNGKMTGKVEYHFGEGKYVVSWQNNNSCGTCEVDENDMKLAQPQKLRILTEEVKQQLLDNGILNVDVDSFEEECECLFNAENAKIVASILIDNGVGFEVYQLYWNDGLTTIFLK